MDHAIESLQSFLESELDSYYQGYSTKTEIKVLVDAINVLEKYQYGEAKTHLHIVLAK